MTLKLAHFNQEFFVEVVNLNPLSLDDSGKKEN
jgi:hypothetical protein